MSAEPYGSALFRFFMSNPHSDPLRPHRHEPNYHAPEGDGNFTLRLPDGSERDFTSEGLYALPYAELRDCYIVSTGHGTSGPFTFGGVGLIELISIFLPAGAAWREVEVTSADGFGNRLFRAELQSQPPARAPLLAYRKDEAPLTRANGLVRLIVPTERDDALRQVKWVHSVRVL